MNMQSIAEILSALAALITMGLACVELCSRSASKKAEAAIDIYAEYLFVRQQLDYAVSNVSKLCGTTKSFTEQEVKAFAKSHMLDSSLLVSLQKIENIGIKTFNPRKEQGQDNARMLLDLTGQAMNLAASVNAFFTAVAEEPAVDHKRIGENAGKIQAEYDTLKESWDATGDVLKKNLKVSHNLSYLYIAFLLCLVCLFLGVHIALV